MTMPWARDPILQLGGECGALMRDLDWAANPLGPPKGWPPELRTVVGLALGSLQPMLIVWGPEQITLYNDGYAAMCGLRHPAALGRPFRDLWFDIWDRVDPIISAAYAGIGTSMDDIEFIMHRKGYPEETHFAFSYTPVRDEAGRVLGMFCACNETTGEVLLRRRQLRERERFLQVFENALGAIAMLTGPDHVFTYANADYLKLIGHRDILGRPVREALPEVAGQGFFGWLDEVYATGAPHSGRSVPLDLQEGAVARERVVDFLYQPVHDELGAVDGIFVQVLDVTDRVAAERRQEMVNREIGHRMKNQLAVVQAIVNQTLRGAADVPAAAASISGRLRALAGAHDLLIAGKTGGTGVSDLVREIRILHDDEAGTRFSVEGPEVEFGAQAALSLSLLLHELATNAVKHGSLREAGGRVAIRWRVVTEAGGSRFQFRWTEAGGPPVVAPAQTGTGTRLIRFGLLGGESEVEIDYRPEGLDCRISAPLSAVMTG